MSIPQILAFVAGGALRVLFACVPGFRSWYDAQLPARKSQIMLASLLLAAVLLFADGCLPQINVFPAEALTACSLQGVADLFVLLVLAAVGNQSVYGLTKNLRAQDSQMRRYEAGLQGYKSI